MALNQIVPVHYFRCPNTHPKKKQAFFFSFSLSPRCSGCRAGEPVPLAPALHHLRRLGAGRRPVVHTQRHQLAAPPDSLPVQCKSCPPLHPQVITSFVVAADCPAPWPLPFLPPPSFWLNSCLSPVCSCDLNLCESRLWLSNLCMCRSMSSVTCLLCYDLYLCWPLLPALRPLADFSALASLCSFTHPFIFFFPLLSLSLPSSSP